MIVVGSGNVPIPGCYIGGGATTFPQRGRIKDAVKQDEVGMKSCANLGRNVAKTIGLLNGIELKEDDPLRKQAEESFRKANA